MCPYTTSSNGSKLAHFFTRLGCQDLDHPPRHLFRLEFHISLSNNACLLRILAQVFDSMLPRVGKSETAGGKVFKTNVRDRYARE